MFGLLKLHRLTLEGREDVGGGVTSFSFRADTPLGARAGQHGVLTLTPTVRKPFSLASAPGEKQILIGTSLASASSFKKRLAALEPGDTVSFRGPVNRFTLDRASGDIVMLAQGVGITPMRSMLAQADLDGSSVHSQLIHVARDGHAYRTDTERWASESEYPDHADAFEKAVAASARTRPVATFYVAGAPAFVSSTAASLRAAGIDRSRILLDKYWLYRPQ